MKPQKSETSGESDYKHVYKYNYKSFLNRFNKNLFTKKATKLRSDLIRQEAVIKDLVEALKSVQKYSSRPERLEAFKTILDEDTEHDFGSFVNIKPTMFMLDPRKTIVGINVEKVFEIENVF